MNAEFCAKEQDMTLRTLWQTNRPLTAVGLLMTVAFAAALVGLAVDPRVITGAPAWMKPAKFGISTAIYAFTLAWVFTYLPDWPRTRAIAGWTTAIVFVIEVAAIDLQAWRGTTSHFNASTPLDAALFAIMGIGIVIQTAASALVAVALWRQRFSDDVMGWALRLGMTITIVGATSGGLMTVPTRAQLAVPHSPVMGAHTVGAPDGGPGLRAVGWSREHGDLRVPHFLGLHALQALAVIGLVLHRRKRSSSVALMQVSAASYLSLFGILMIQALRSQSIAQPDAGTIAALAVWAVATATSWWMITRARPVSSTATAFIA